MQILSLIATPSRKNKQVYFGAVYAKSKTEPPYRPDIVKYSNNLLFRFFLVAYTTTNICVFVHFLSLIATPSREDK